MASMEPDATQNLPTQVYKDFYANRARSSFEPSDEASREPGDSRYVDLEQNFSPVDPVDDPFQNDEHGDGADASSPNELPPPRTPAMAGHKRDSQGNIVSSAVTPGSGLTAMFKKTAGGANVVPLSQVFNQTQQPSSPFPNGLRSDPVFDRPSPELHHHHSPFSSMASSPMSTQQSTGKELVPSSTEAYITMQDSQKRREQKQRNADINPVHSSMQSSEKASDSDSDDENSIERRIAKELQWGKIQEQGLRGFARLHQRSTPKAPGSKKTPPVVDLITPKTIATNAKLPPKKRHSFDTRSSQVKLNSSARLDYSGSDSPDRRSPSQEQSRIEVTNTPPQSDCPNPVLPIQELSGDVVPATSITYSSPARYDEFGSADPREHLNGDGLAILGTLPTNTPEAAQNQFSSVSIIVNSVEHQRSGPSGSKNDSGFVTAQTHQSGSPSRESANGERRTFRTLREIAADPSPPQASGTSFREYENLLNNDQEEYGAVVTTSKSARNLEDGMGTFQEKDDQQIPSPGPPENQSTNALHARTTDWIANDDIGRRKNPSRVLALFADLRMAYFPATCLAKSGESQYKVQFDDGNISDVKEQHVRSLELIQGDLVKVDLPGRRTNIYVVCRMKDLCDFESATQSPNPKTDIYGHKTAVLAVKGRNSLSGTNSETSTIEIPVCNLYTNGGAMWHQFRTRPFHFVANGPSLHGELRNPSSHASRVNTPQAEHGDILNNAANSNLEGIFSGMAFVITYHEGNEKLKNRVTRTVLEHGGQVIKTGFYELFHSDDSGVSLNSVGSSLGFTAVLADNHSRRPKHIQSLSLNVPCLSGRWALDCVAHSTLLPWTSYAIAAGESKVLDGAIVSRVFPPETPSPTNFDVRFSTFFEQRRLILGDQDVVLVLSKKTDEKSRLFRFLCFVMGARSVKLESKKSKAETSSDTNEGGATKPLLLGDEAIIQSLIVGRLVRG